MSTTAGEHALEASSFARNSADADLNRRNKISKLNRANRKKLQADSN
mgnify:CR=1 FL=1